VSVCRQWERKYIRLEIVQGTLYCASFLFLGKFMTEGAHSCNRYGLYGETDDVPVYCHAGGNGPDDYVCVQVSRVDVTISSA